MNGLKITIALLTLLLHTQLQGEQRVLIIDSKYLNCNDTVLITTPTIKSGYSSPTLFLLHGWSGSWRDWNKRAQLQEMSNKYGFTIITPDGFYDSWYVNNPNSDGMQWRTFFDRELYPQIAEQYRLDTETTFISGLSMGGHGAVNIFLDDISRFRAAGSMSGVLSLNDIRDRINSAPTQQESAIERLSLYNQQIAKDEKLKERVLIISCGTEDSLIDSTIEFSKKCNSLSINNMLILSPGTHSWRHWIYSLDLHLFFFNKIVKGEHLGY